MIMGILVSFKNSSFETLTARNGPEELSIAACTSSLGNGKPEPGLSVDRRIPWAKRTQSGVGRWVLEETAGQRPSSPLPVKTPRGNPGGVSEDR